MNGSGRTTSTSKSKSLRMSMLSRNLVKVNPGLSHLFAIAQEKKLKEETAHLETQLQEVKTSRPDARDPRENQDTSPSRFWCHLFRKCVY